MRYKYNLYNPSCNPPTNPISNSPSLFLPIFTPLHNLPPPLTHPKQPRAITTTTTTTTHALPTIPPRPRPSPPHPHPRRPPPPPRSRQTRPTSHRPKQPASKRRRSSSPAIRAFRLPPGILSGPAETAGSGRWDTAEAERLETCAAGGFKTGPELPTPSPPRANGYAFQARHHRPAA